MNKSSMNPIRANVSSLLKRTIGKDLGVGSQRGELLRNVKEAKTDEQKSVAINKYLDYTSNQKGKKISQKIDFSTVKKVIDTIDNAETKNTAMEKVAGFLDKSGTPPRIKDKILDSFPCILSHSKSTDPSIIKENATLFLNSLTYNTEKHSEAIYSLPENILNECCKSTNTDSGAIGMDGQQNTLSNIISESAIANPEKTKELFSKLTPQSALTMYLKAPKGSGGVNFESRPHLAKAMTTEQKIEVFKHIGENSSKMDGSGCKELLVAIQVMGDTDLSSLGQTTKQTLKDMTENVVWHMADNHENAQNKISSFLEKLK